MFINHVSYSKKVRFYDMSNKHSTSESCKTLAGNNKQNILDTFLVLKMRFFKKTLGSFSSFKQ